MIDIQDLRTHEALVNYKKMIVSAVEEVENALSAYSAEQDRLQDLNDALVASQRAVTLANERYDRGLTDFLNVTDAERQLYEIQDQYAIAQEDVVVQFIAIYKSLGGGWEAYQKIPADPQASARDRCHRSRNYIAGQSTEMNPRITAATGDTTQSPDL